MELSMQYVRLKMASRGKRVKEASQIDKLAFDDLYHKYSSPVFKFAFSLMKNQGEAEDLFQETWLRVVQNFHKISDKQTFKSWVFTITVNLYRDELRKRKTRRLFLFQKIKTTPLEYETSLRFAGKRQVDITNEPDYADTGRAITRAIDSLPGRQRLVFILKEVEGLKYSEIHEILKLPIGTLKTLTFRAVRRLRRELSAYGPQTLYSREGEKNEM
jgi:RNA polymerase sigma-70 factor (ECF subfamily)